MHFKCLLCTHGKIKIMNFMIFFLFKHRYIIEKNATFAKIFLEMAKTKQKEENLGAVEVTVDKSESFLEKHQKVVTICVAAAIVIVIAIFALQKYYFQPREVAAQNSVYTAQKYFGNDEFDKALNGDGNDLGFLDVIDQYKSTTVGKTAYYYAGISYLRLGEYESAIEYLKKYNPREKDYYVYAISKAAIGDAYVELEDYNNAVKYYSEAASINKNELTTPEFMKKLAFAYELSGNNKKALDTYKKIKADYPNAAIKQEVNRNIGRLEEALK
jgi:tetratricopeptide (TPR) repeat protein